MIIVLGELSTELITFTACQQLSKLFKHFKDIRNRLVHMLSQSQDVGADVLVHLTENAGKLREEASSLRELMAQKSWQESLDTYFCDQKTHTPLRTEKASAVQTSTSTSEMKSQQEKKSDPSEILLKLIKAHKKYQEEAKETHKKNIADGIEKMLDSYNQAVTADKYLAFGDIGVKASVLRQEYVSAPAENTKISQSKHALFAKQGAVKRLGAVSEEINYMVTVIHDDTIDWVKKVPVLRFAMVRVVEFFERLRISGCNQSYEDIKNRFMANMPFLSRSIDQTITTRHHGVAHEPYHFDQQMFLESIVSATAPIRTDLACLAYLPTMDNKEEAINACPQRPRYHMMLFVYQNMNTAYMRLGLYQEAKACLEQAREAFRSYDLNPLSTEEKQVFYQYYCALLNECLVFYQEAVGASEPLVEEIAQELLAELLALRQQGKLGSDFPREVVHNVAGLYLRLGQKDQAYQWFETIININDLGEDAQSEIIYLQYAFQLALDDRESANRKAEEMIAKFKDKVWHSPFCQSVFLLARFYVLRKFATLEEARDALLEVDNCINKYKPFFIQNFGYQIFIHKETDAAKAAIDYLKSCWDGFVHDQRYPMPGLASINGVFAKIFRLYDEAGSTTVVFARQRFRILHNITLDVLASLHRPEIDMTCLSETVQALKNLVRLKEQLQHTADTAPILFQIAQFLQTLQEFEGQNHTREIMHYWHLSIATFQGTPECSEDLERDNEEMLITAMTKLAEKYHEQGEYALALFYCAQKPHTTIEFQEAWMHYRNRKVYCEAGDLTQEAACELIKSLGVQPEDQLSSLDLDTAHKCLRMYVPLPVLEKHQQMALRANTQKEAVQLDSDQLFALREQFSSIEIETNDAASQLYLMADAGTMARIQRSAILKGDVAQDASLRLGMPKG